MIPFTVIPGKFVVSWPPQHADTRKQPAPIAYAVDLPTGLTTQYSTEAYAQASWVDGSAGPWLKHTYRLRKEAPAELEKTGRYVRFSSLWFDFDTGKGVNHVPATPQWYATQLAKLINMPAPWDGFVYYETHKGCRIVYGLEQPMDLATHNRAGRYVFGLLEQVGLQPDTSCSDWTRLYKLPWVPGHTHHRLLHERYRPVSPNVIVQIPEPAQSPLPTHVGADESWRTSDPIEGGRNSWLTSVAGFLRYKGLSYEMIRYTLAGCLATGKVAGDFTLQECEQIARSVCRYEQGSHRFERGSDVELGEFLLTQLSPVLDVAFDQGQMYVYSPDQGIWANKPTAELENLCAHLLDGAEITKGTDKDGTPKVSAIALSNQRVRSIVERARTASTKAGFFDNAPPSAVFRNGHIVVRSDLGRVELVQPSPDTRARARIDANFEPQAIPHIFIDYMRSLRKDDTEIQTYREFLGAALLGVTYQFQQALLLIGDGANGKSTFAVFLESLFNTGEVTYLTPDELETEYNRNMIVHSRLNVMDEVNAKEVQATKEIKKLIVGATMQARPITQAPFNWKPRTAVLWMMNRLPSIRDTSEGFFRRWIVLPWDYEIPEHIRMPESQVLSLLAQDKYAVISWAIASLPDLLARRRYTIPAVSKEAVESWKQDNDSAADFAVNKLVPLADGELWVTASDIYSAYKLFCIESGRMPLALRSFGHRLKRTGLKWILSTRRSNGIYYSAKVRQQ